MKKFSYLILPCALLAGCSSEPATVPLNDFYGISIPEFKQEEQVLLPVEAPYYGQGSKVRAFEYQDLSLKEAIAWLEEAKPADSAGMSRKELTTDASVEMPNAKDDLSGTVRAGACWSSVRDPQTLLVEKTETVDVIELENGKTMLSIMTLDNHVGCEQDPELKLLQDEIDARYGQKSGTAAGGDFEKLGSSIGALADALLSN